MAIIGTGISGMAAAYYLRDVYDITIFEKNDYVGGHANTIEVEEDDISIPVDTGFIVFNHITYPNLVHFFKELEVPIQKSDMSFSVYNLESGWQWAGDHFFTLFAQRKNLFSLPFWNFLREIKYFNKRARFDLKNKNFNEKSVIDYVKEHRFSDRFLNNFLVPMGSAIWSTPIQKMMDFPIETLIRFFQNHGFLGMNTQHQWYTVTGGSRIYMEKIQKKLKKKVKVNEKVHKVHQARDRVYVKTQKETAAFDRLLIATHADDALDILENPTKIQKELLNCFQYEKNQAILHTDIRVMPPLKRIWASWNYKLQKTGSSPSSSTVYFINRLQNLKTKNHYMVSINELHAIDERKIIRVIDYKHPLFDQKAIDAQKVIHKLSESGGVFFAGSYFRYGFHEDALLSSLEAVKGLKKTA